MVTTIFPQYDFVRQIAGGRADLKMLLKPGEESHSYEPTPQDIIAIQNCDLFIYVGGENDEWVEDILSSMDTGRMATQMCIRDRDNLLPYVWKTGGRKRHAIPHGRSQHGPAGEK